MVRNLNEYLSTTQVGVSLAGIILGWIGEQTTEHFVLDFLSLFNLSVSTAVLRGISIVIGVFLLTYLEVVLTEIVPKKYRNRHATQSNGGYYDTITVVPRDVLPLRMVVECLISWRRQMLGIPVANEDNDVYSQAEILNLSRNAVTGGELERNDYLYMERAFEFNDKIAKDIMIDRTQ
jgi:CBS domain containing-hemolysin-like protein